jgi:hypothetical protein
MTDEIAALDLRLASNPGDIAALVRKGELLTAEGGDRAAAAFYRRALGLAATGALPSSLAGVIERAQAGLARAQIRFGDHLQSCLQAAGLGPGSRPPRFQEALELLEGKRQTTLQLQRPGAFYYPGLPQRRYYERSEFSWAPELEAQFVLLLQEFNDLARSGDQFTPYMVSDASRPRADVHGLLDNPEWSTLYLHKNGKPVEEVVVQVPFTYEAIAALDLPRITMRAPSILYSRLSAGARIPPHNGMINARLICHLPLIVPPDCGFRVGGETRVWKSGELLCFDDSIEHEAWNRSTEDRVILIFDIWRPELNAEERRAVTAVFEAIDSY